MKTMMLHHVRMQLKEAHENNDATSCMQLKEAHENNDATSCMQLKEAHENNMMLHHVCN